MCPKKPFTPNDRDQEILWLTYEYRYVSLEVLHALLQEPPKEGRSYGFGLSGLRARCQKLRENGYLVWQHLRDEPVGRGYHTEHPMVYSVGQAASDVLAARTGLTPRQFKAAIGRNAVSSFFLRHELGISRFRACLELACRGTTGKVSIGTWLQDGLKDCVRVDVDGEEQIIPVVPDALFSLIVRRSDGRTTLSHFALEFDMGTMSEVRIATKARGLWHYIEKGLHRRKYTYAGESSNKPELRVVAEKWDRISPDKQEAIVAHGMRTLQVLFVTRAVSKDMEKLRSGAQPDRERQKRMIDAVSHQSEITVSTSRLLFCTEDLYYGTGGQTSVFKPIWMTVNPDGRTISILAGITGYVSSKSVCRE